MRAIAGPAELEARAAALARAKRRGAADGHAAVARALRSAGVTTVYGIPGTPVYETFGACAREGLRVIGARHQQGATLMALAHNYFSGAQQAAVLVSAGAAAANCMSALLVARDNAWPLVLLAGTTSRATPFDGEFMQCDVEALFRPVTKGERSPIRDRGIVAALRHAFELAAECRPGPVVVALPADALQHTVTDDREDPVERSPEPRIAGTAIDKAARRLAAARRPLAIIGKGARWNDAYRDIAALIDRVGMPFITSPIARGFLPDDHPLCFNAVATSAQQGADVVVILGAWLDWTFRYGTQIARDATLIQIDPDPGEFHRNRAVALPIEGAIGACVRALLERISTLDRACERPGVDQEWTARLALSRNAALERRRREGQPSSGPITPQRLAQVLNDALPADALCMFDGNVVLAACERQIVARTPVSRLTPGTSGCLGTGVPYAIGAKLACPDRPVVAVCGDFAFGLTAFEIETAVRHDVPIVVVIANNDGNGGALRQREMFGDASVGRVAAFQPGIHYEQIAAMFGGHAEHVACAGELASALRRALAANRPACVNVAIDPEAPPPRG